MTCGSHRQFKTNSPSNYHRWRQSRSQMVTVDTQIEERTSPLMVKPEIATALPGTEPFECQEAPPWPAQVFSGSENLDDLPPSPPPLPLVSESTNVPESGYENLNPVPLRSASALFAPKMPKSVVSGSEHENLCRNTREKGPTGDEIPSEDETAAPLQPSSVRPLEEDTQVRSNPLDQEIETVSCQSRDETHAVHSFETVPYANRITNELALKKSRTMCKMPVSGCRNLNPVSRRPRTLRKPQTMHKMPDQLTEACQMDIDMDPLVSGSTEAGPTGEEEMEASQIDMNKSNEVSDRPLREMAPPGSDTRDSETPAPPEIRTKGCLKNMIPVSVYTGGEVQFNHMGADYSIPPTITFPGTEHTTFKDVTDEIYKALKLSEDLFSLTIQARYNAVSTGPFFFTLLAINDDKAWQMVFEMAVSGMNWRIIELYVKLVPNQTSQNDNPDPTSSHGTSSLPQWSMPMHATPSQTMSFNYPTQTYWSRPQQVPNQACQNYNSNPTSSGGTRSVTQQSMPMHVIPSQTMPHNAPVQGSCSRPNPIPRNFPSKSSRTQQNTPMHAKPSQTKPKPPLPLISELMMLESECGNLNPVTQNPQTVHETPDQLTKACQPDVSTNPLVSGTTDTGPPGDEQMEVSQIDTNKDDEVAVSDIPPTEMAPSGSDTRDSETPVPLARRIQVTPSVWSTKMLCVTLSVGGKFRYASEGAIYSKAPKYSFPVTSDHTFEDVKGMIYSRIGYSEDQYGLNLKTRIDTGKGSKCYFQLILITDQRGWEMTHQIFLSSGVPVLELYVKLVPSVTGLDMNSGHGSGYDHYVQSPNSANLGSFSVNQMSRFSQMHSLKRKAVGIWEGKDRGKVEAGGAYKVNVAQQSMPMHLNPSQTMPHNAPVQGSCSRPIPVPRSFPSTSSRTQQNMPMHAKPSQTKPYDSPLQGPCTRLPMVPNHSNPSRPGTSSTAQQRMPMHANPSQTMPYNYPVQGSHQNMDNIVADLDVQDFMNEQRQSIPFINRGMKHSCPSVNDQRAMPYKDRPSFSNARRFDDPLAEGQTFDSIDHLKAKIFEIHIKENMKLQVEDDNKNIYAVNCKDSYCIWGLCAKPTGTGSWIISTNPFKHTCCGKVHVIDQNTQMTARGSHQNSLPDSNSRFSQGQSPNSTNLVSFSVNQMSRLRALAERKGSWNLGAQGAKGHAKVKAGGAYKLKTASAGTVRSTIPDQLREQTES